MNVFSIKITSTLKSYRINFFLIYIDANFNIIFVKKNILKTGYPENYY